MISPTSAASRIDRRRANIRSSRRERLRCSRARAATGDVTTGAQDSIVIRLASEDLMGPVELLEQHDASELVGKRDLAE